MSGERGVDRAAAPPRREPDALAGYRRRVLTALKWSASGEVGFQAIRFAFGIALARLLSPQDFGLMAMLMILLTFAAGSADLGFEEALVQKRDVAEVHFSSVFWSLLLSGLAPMVLLIWAAPWIAHFYGVPELERLARVLSLLFLLRVLGAVPRAILARRLDFRVAASRRCLAAGLAGACAVTLAWRGFGVTSLVAEALLSTGLESVLFLRASRWHPRLELRLAALRELAGFSVHRPAARTLNYWAQRIDQLLIGKLLGSMDLGLYSRAFNVARLPVNSTSRVILDVLFPSLSMIQEDAGRVRGLYLRATGAIALATVPMCLGLCVAAEPFVLGVLGPQWRDAIPVLRILSVAGIFQNLTVFTTSLYLSQGRTDLLLRLTVVQRLLMIAAIVIALRWGLLGVATAQLLSAACTTVPMLYFAGRLVDLPLRAVLKHLWPVFLAGASMASLVWAVGLWASSWLAPIEVFALEAVAGVAIYWAALRLLRVEAYHDVAGLLAQPSALADEPFPERGDGPARADR